MRQVNDQKVSSESLAKLQGGILYRPRIWKLRIESEFDKCMTEFEQLTWIYLKAVERNILGNKKAGRYKEPLVNML